MNESSAISVFNIDTNLLSGSNDLFRNALGMSWITLDASLDYDSSTEEGNVLFCQRWQLAQCFIVIIIVNLRGRPRAIPIFTHQEA